MTTTTNQALKSPNGKLEMIDPVAREQFRQSEWFTRGLMVVAALLHEGFVELPKTVGQEQMLISAAELVGSYAMYFDKTAVEQHACPGDHVVGPLYDYLITR